MPVEDSGTTPEAARRGERRFARTVVLPIAGVVIAMTLAVVALLIWTGVQQDRLAIDAGRKLAGGAVAARMDSVGRQAYDYASWDEAFEKLHGAFDLDWADANIGPYIAEAFEYELSFVIGPDGTTRYAMVEGERSSETLESQLGVEIAELVAASRGAPTAKSERTGLVRVGEDIGMAGVATIRPVAEDLELPPGERSTLVIVDLLDDEALAELGAKYLLAQLHLAQPDRPPDAAFFQLYLADGRPGPRIAWTPDRPSRDLWRSILPVLVVAIVLLSAFVTVVLRHGSKAAEQIAESEARARHMALHDALTGLPNRVLFTDRLERALAGLSRTGGTVALISLDLDGFKGINDIFGHGVGDQLLAAVSARLLSTLRRTDTVARLGGDEFTMVQVGGSQPEHAESLARRVLGALTEPFTLDSHVVRIGASIGIAVAPQDGTTVDQLAKRADIALYKAKQQGRGTFCFFEPSLDATLALRRTLEHDLRSAVAAEQLAVHYQPQFDVRSRTMVGVEALVRWRHPEHGDVPPGQFIPLAEETGLIHQIGSWVLRRACRDAAGWPDLRLSVNLSAAQFRDPNLVAIVEAALADSGLEPHRLELELTESALFDNPDAAAHVLAELRELGVALAMDDFGTGYSSLSQLHQFPFDTLKIDQAFIRRLGEDDSSATIVRAILGMSRGLGLTTVAEGIETAGQLAFLAEESCELAQGFHLGRPVPAAEIGAIIEAPELPVPVPA